MFSEQGSPFLKQDIQLPFQMTNGALQLLDPLAFPSEQDKATSISKDMTGWPAERKARPAPPYLPESRRE
jgi:hypothetical protein